MLKIISNLVIKFIVTIICIILISALPSLMNHGINFNWATYYNQLSDIVRQLSTPWDMQVFKPNGSSYTLFPRYFNFYTYSMELILISFIISFIIGLIFTYLAMLRSQRFIRRVKGFLSLWEAVPDLFVIAVLVLGVLFLYKKTGFLLFPVAGAFEHTYFMPIFVMSFLPSLLFFRVMLLAFSDENSEIYVDLARVKGLSKSRVLINHILRNAIFTIAGHVQSIFYFLLSTLVIVEQIFNIYGVTFFILEFPDLKILAVTIILIFIPIFIIIAAARIASYAITGKEAKI